MFELLEVPQDIVNLFLITAHHILSEISLTKNLSTMFELLEVPQEIVNLFLITALPIINCLR